MGSMNTLVIDGLYSVGGNSLIGLEGEEQHCGLDLLQRLGFRRLAR